MNKTFPRNAISELDGLKHQIHEAYLSKTKTKEALDLTAQQLVNESVKWLDRLVFNALEDLQSGNILTIEKPKSICLPSQSRTDSLIKSTTPTLDVSAPTLLHVVRLIQNAPDTALLKHVANALHQKSLHTFIGDFEVAVLNDGSRFDARMGLTIEDVSTSLYRIMNLSSVNRRTLTIQTPPPKCLHN